MSKKHFQKLAYELMRARPEPRNLAQNSSYDVWSRCVNAVADACAQSNSAFDRARFRVACEAESYTPSMHGR